MTITIIRDEKELNKLISLTIQTGKKYHERLHQATMSAAVHLLEFGQPGPLNVLYKSMTSNNSAAFKQFLRRLNLYVGLGFDVVDKMTAKEIAAIEPELRNGFIAKGTVVGYEKGTFIVTSVKADPEAKEKRLMGVKFLEQRFLNADMNDAKFKPWYERNNFADVRLLGDAQAMEQLKRIRDSITKPNADRVKVEVSERMKAIINTAFDNAESLVESDVGHSQSRDNAIVDSALVAREHKATKGKTKDAVKAEPAGSTAH